MPIIALILPALHGFFSALYGFLSSRIGQTMLIAAVSFFFGVHHAKNEYAAERAAMKIAHMREVARERAAAEDIARDATERAGQDALAMRSMQAKIDKFSNSERSLPDVLPPIHSVPERPCLVDGDFARVLRELDAPGDRAPKPSRRPR